jgi:hypothetical protein
MFFTGLELTAKRNVLNILKEHYYVLLQNKKNMLNRVAWFYAEPCRAQKHAQEDKKTRRQTELNQKSVLKGELLIWKTKNHGRDQGYSPLYNSRIQFASNQFLENWTLDPGPSSKVGLNLVLSSSETGPWTLDPPLKWA